MKISSQYARAVAFAADAHAGQVRKGSNAPYLSHLVGVSARVMAHGGDEEQCIAALLHDVIEDQAAHMGGHEILRNMIATAFGPRVLRIVNDCTDADGDPKPPWLERKKSYIAHLDEVDDDTMLVVCCDKLDNLESIVSDVRNPLVGLNVFERFKGKQEGTIWYHTELRKPFMGNVPQALLDQYINGLEDLQKAIAAAS